MYHGKLCSSLGLFITLLVSFSHQLASSLSFNTRFRNNYDPRLKLPTRFPKDLEKHCQTEYFTKDDIPKSLMDRHSTKRGTWGIIRVSSGRLLYSKLNNNEGGDHYDIDVLDMYTPGMIEPTVVHEVSPLTDDVEFHVEFYRFPNTGEVDELRERL